MPKSYLLNNEIINYKVPTTTRTALAGGGTATIIIEGHLPVEYWQVCRAHINLALPATRHFTGYTEKHQTFITATEIYTQITIQDSQFHLTHIPIDKGHYKNTVGELINYFAGLTDAEQLLPVIYQCSKVRVNDPSGLYPFLLVDIEQAPIEFDITQENFTFDQFIRYVCDIYGANYCIDHTTEKLVIYNSNYNFDNSLPLANNEIKILNLDILNIGCADKNGDLISDFNFSIEPAKLAGVLLIGHNGDKTPDGRIVNILHSKTTVFNSGIDGDGIPQSQLSYQLPSGWDLVLNPAILRWQVLTPLTPHDFRHVDSTTIILNNTYSLPTVSGSSIIRNYFYPDVGEVVRFTGHIDFAGNTYSSGTGFINQSNLPFTNEIWGYTLPADSSASPSTFNYNTSETITGTINLDDIAEDKSTLTLFMRLFGGRHKSYSGDPFTLSTGTTSITLKINGITLYTNTFVDGDDLGSQEGEITTQFIHLADYNLISGILNIELNISGDFNQAVYWFDNGFVRGYSFVGFYYYLWCILVPASYEFDGDRNIDGPSNDGFTVFTNKPVYP